MGWNCAWRGTSERSNPIEMGMHLEAKVYWNLVHNETAGESGGEGMNSTCTDIGAGGGGKIAPAV